MLRRMPRLFALYIVLEYLKYFDDLTKLFSDLYLIKFLNILAKSFFSCMSK